MVWLGAPELSILFILALEWPAGNDLIVEHIIEFRAWREYLATLLEAWKSSSSACTAI